MSTTLSYSMCNIQDELGSTTKKKIVRAKINQK